MQGETTVRCFTRLLGRVTKSAMNEEPWRTRMQRRRKQIGLTQAQLAEKLGLSQGTITHWECGRREPEDLATLEKLARALDMHPAELIYGIEVLPQPAIDVGRYWLQLNDGAKEAMATTIRTLVSH